MANIADAAPERFIGASESFASVGLDVAGIAFGHPLRLRWWLAFAAAMGLLGVLAVSLGFILYEGVGVWGNNIPVTWALDIVSYDWWIGIASGGLLISAMLMLFGTEWRGALNRLTETGALIAAAAAAVYPIIHLGRPWYFYWNLPYPNTFLLWPQFRSPLYWDAIDIISYLMIALTFWTLGLLPDLATLRDRAIERWRETGRGKYRAYLYGIFALGWRGSARHWDRWLQAYRIVAVTGVLLVFSLQTGAAVMFAGTVEPGWHDPLLPFAYVATAIFSGVAFMAAAAVVLRWIFRLDGMITDAHLKVMAVLLLVLGLVNLYCYGAEFFSTLLGNDSFETAVMGRRLAGSHAWAFWDMVILALLPVHVFWFRAERRGRRPFHGDRYDAAARFPAVRGAPFQQRHLGDRDLPGFGGPVLHSGAPGAALPTRGVDRRSTPVEPARRRRARHRRAARRHAREGCGRGHCEREGRPCRRMRTRRPRRRFSRSRRNSTAATRCWPA